METREESLAEIRLSFAEIDVILECLIDELPPPTNHER